MTTEEQANLMETNGMMEALGYKLIETTEAPEGIYVKYMLPKKIENKEKRLEMGEIPAAQ